MCSGLCPPRSAPSAPSRRSMEMWSNAHAKYLQGYHKPMSTDSSGRVYIPSCNTWDELEGEDWKAKLAALNTEDWLAKFKKFLLKTSTCRWDTQPDAGDIDSWLRWYAASALHRTGHSLPLRGAGVPS